MIPAAGVLYLHYRIIERTGGRHGVRDVRLLESALARCRDRS
jgi:prophage maintenance system killer protein